MNNLVNEIDIWINPLANPDGAYAGETKMCGMQQDTMPIGLI